MKEEVEVVFEKKVTPFGNSAKVDVPKRYLGWRAYVIVVKDRGILSQNHSLECL
ncbi:MAG: DUF2080 family transposase-associated protein [Candidatus Syntropharchaeales archaeon]